MQSILDEQAADLHVAIIMDGNGRWATRRGLPRSAGHRAGVRARRVVEAAPDLGVDHPHAVCVLDRQLATAARGSERADVTAAALPALRTSASGRKRRAADRHRPARPAAGRRANARSTPPSSIRPRADGSICGSRSTIRRATPSRTRRVGWLGRRLAVARRVRPPARPAGQGRDATSIFSIRTGGEKRLSDFLLWECAYAELRFTDTMWPDFGADDLPRRIADFRAPRAPLRRAAGSRRCSTAAE